MFDWVLNTPPEYYNNFFSDVSTLKLMAFWFFFQRLTFPTNTCQRLWCIQNPIEHLEWSFFAIFSPKIHKKTPTHVSFYWSYRQVSILRISSSEMFCEKSALKISSKFTGEQPCRSVISIKLFRNFIEITICNGCYPVNLLHIFRTPFSKNISGGYFYILQHHWKKRPQHGSFLMNFARYLRHLFYRTSPSNCLCSMEKYFPNNIVKNPLRKGRNGNSL